MGAALEPVSVFTTATAPESQRLAFWSHVVCRSIAGIEATALGDAQTYAGEIRRRAIPMISTAGFDMLRVTADPQRVTRTPELIKARAEDAWLLMIQGAGSCTVTQGGRHVTLSQGDIAFLDTSRPYEVSFPHPFRQSIIKVATDCFHRLLPMTRDVAGLALSGRDPLVAIACHNIQLLDRLANRIEPALLSSAAEHAIDHLALAMRATLQVGEARRGGGALERHLAQASIYISQHLHEHALSVDRIAHATGVSTGHLHEIFRQAGESTVADYVRERRLAQCRRDLADERLQNDSITTIAFRWGFSESSSFSRAFRRAFDTTPRRFRQDSQHKRRSS